jgi:beta-fructofuranosidase
MPGGDSDIWKEGEAYYGVISGVEKYYPKFKNTSDGHAHSLGAWPNWSIWSSKDLLNWTSLGPLLFEKTPLTDRFDDGSCPNFVPIGDKYILLHFSHQTGGQYLLGDYDPHTHRFRPYAHDRFNHGNVVPGGVHAPSAASDSDGGVINILNINEARYTPEWDHIMSLPQRLTLGADKRVRIEPVDAVTSLRHAHQRVRETRLPANQEVVLTGIRGNALELDLEIDPGKARSVQLSVLRSSNAEEVTTITFHNFDPKHTEWAESVPEEVVLDNSRSSTLPDAWSRPPERAVVSREGGPLKLRVFIDRSVVEVFANGRQYLAIRVYPGRQDSLGVALRAQSSDAILTSLDAWQMKAIWPVASAQ